MSDVARWRSETPLVGRGDEIAALVDALPEGGGPTVTGEPTEARGRATTILLAGDAGVGKTRLLDEVIRLARESGRTVLVGHCVDIGDVGLPYLPFSEILTTISADPDLRPCLDRHPEVGRLLRTDAASDADRAPDSRMQLFGAMAALLTDLAAVHPLLLVIEDLHWADRSTRELLHFLLSRLRAEPLTVIASYRSDDLHRAHPLRPLLAELVRLPSVNRRTLDPLPDGDVADLLGVLHPDRLDERVVDEIVRRVEGNAFYAEELLAATVDAAGPGRRAGAVPEALADVLLTRLEQLPAAAQWVVRVASVAGRRVGHDLLRTVAELPEDDLDAALREAMGRHLLVSDDGATYAFRHALLRDAVYADLLPGERARLHAAFAAAMTGGTYDSQTSGEDAALRAHHFTESHDLPGALRASLDAADHAAAVGAPAEELQHLERVLSLWSAVPDASQIAGHSDIVLTLRATTAAAQAGELNRAVALTRSALDRMGTSHDNELIARIRYTLAESLLHVDRDEAAYKESSAALALIPSDPPSPTWLWAAATHVRTSYFVGDIDGVKALGARALAAAEHLDADDVLADLLISLTPVSTQGRTTPSGQDQLRRALTLAEGIGDNSLQLRAMFNLAIGAYEGGDMPTALRWARAGLALAARTGLAHSVYGLEQHFIEALALHSVGRWDECLQVVARAAGAHGAATAHVDTIGLLIHVARGESADVAGNRSGESDHPAATVNLACAAIEQALWRGDAAAAVARCDQLRADLLSAYGETGLALVRAAALALTAAADAAVAARRTEDVEASVTWIAEADRLLAMARQVTDERSGPLAASEVRGPEVQAWVLRAVAEHARANAADDQVGRWREAVEATNYGNVYAQAWARWRHAEALVEADDRDSADTEVAVALELAEGLRAVPLRGAIRGLRRRARLGPPTARQVDHILTPRERDVLRLVSKGRSNRQIGAELYISDKTASVHVSNILAKLHAGTRAEAAAIALRDGLV